MESLLFLYMTSMHGVCTCTCMSVKSQLSLSLSHTHTHTHTRERCCKASQLTGHGVCVQCTGIDVGLLGSNGWIEMI